MEAAHDIDLGAMASGVSRNGSWPTSMPSTGRLRGRRAERRPDPDGRDGGPRPLSRRCRPRSPRPPAPAGNPQGIVVPARLPAPERGYTTGVEVVVAVGIIGGRYRISGLLGEGGHMAVGFSMPSTTASSAAWPSRSCVPSIVPARHAHAVPAGGADRRTSRPSQHRRRAGLRRGRIDVVSGHGATARHDAARRDRARTARAAEGPIRHCRGSGRGLAAAHARGALHRESSPATSCSRGTGIPRSPTSASQRASTPTPSPTPERRPTLTGVVLGTPADPAPERRTGGSATVSSDLFVVGAMMVEAVTGRRCGARRSGCRRSSAPAA